MPRLATYSLFLGSRKPGTSFRKTDESLVQTVTLRFFPEGCSILRVAGTWYDPARARFYREDARQVLVTTSRFHRLRAWAAAIGRALGQKEVLLVRVGRAWRFAPRRQSAGRARKIR